MKILTNNHWRQFVYGYELTDAERKEFDYVDDIDMHDFIRYRGAVIDPGEFMAISGTMLLHDDMAPLADWQGYQSDTYFSGLVIRYSDDCETYQIGVYST